MGFTENIHEFMVVWWDTSHVDRGIIGGGLVRKKELVDLGIVHLGEMGKSCYVDEGDFWCNEQSWSWRGWRVR